jgi:hypothetical protein
MLSGRIAAECAYVDERSGVGSGSNPQLRSRGNTESNSDGRRGASTGLGRRSLLPALIYDFCTVRFGGGEPTFAGASCNDEDAPKPAVRLSWVERIKPSSRLYGCLPHGR